MSLSSQNLELVLIFAQIYSWILDNGLLEVHRTLALHYTGTGVYQSFPGKIKINFVFQVNLLSKYTIVDRQGHKGGDSNSNHWKIYIRAKVLSTVHTVEVRPEPATTAIFYISIGNQNHYQCW